MGEATRPRMNGRELCEAIPPAYTEYLGRQLLAHRVTRTVIEGASEQ